MGYREDLRVSQKVKGTLRSLDVRPRKEKGQNFVTDHSILDAIVEFGARNSLADHIVEIGPGLGALTEKLLLLMKKLTVIEIEERFCTHLKESYPPLNVIHADVTSFDFSTLAPSPLTVYGNIPYSRSSEILFHLLDYRESIQNVVLLAQKEFAERLAAPPGNKVYGAPSIIIQSVADVTLGPIIPGTAFFPTAKVESRVVQLRFLENPLVSKSEHPYFARVVRAAFSKRRKMIHNSLRSSGFFTSEEVDQALEAVQIAKERRAETVSVKEFVTLARTFRANGSTLKGTYKAA